jgi:hypothetical protein
MQARQMKPSVTGTLVILGTLSMGVAFVVLLTTTYVWPVIALIALSIFCTLVIADIWVGQLMSNPSRKE